MNPILVLRFTGTAKQVFTAWERIVKDYGAWTLGEIVEEKNAR
jgi:hypothetical protein